MEKKEVVPFLSTILDVVLFLCWRNTGFHVVVPHAYSLSWISREPDQVSSWRVATHHVSVDLLGRFESFSDVLGPFHHVITNVF